MYALTHYLSMWSRMLVAPPRWTTGRHWLGLGHRFVKPLGCKVENRWNDSGKLRVIPWGVGNDLLPAACFFHVELAVFSVLGSQAMQVWGLALGTAMKLKICRNLLSQWVKPFRWHSTTPPGSTAVYTVLPSALRSLKTTEFNLSQVIRFTES